MEPEPGPSKALYRQRRPQNTPLYQLLDRHFDAFKSSYEERFERRYGPWRFVWDQVVPKYLDCGVFRCGFARIFCPACRKEFLLPFSCKSRLCPSCEQKRMLLFAERILHDVLLPVPHRFWTFSIPKALRGLMLRDRRLLGLLPRCAFEAVRAAMRETLQDGAASNGAPGAVLALHTAGNLLQWNPHAHGMFTEGLFDKEGTFWPMPDLRSENVEALFQTSLLEALLARERISPALLASMASWNHSGFSVHSKPAPADPRDPGLSRMLRYMKRPAVALARIAVEKEEGKVLYTADFNPLLGTDRIETEPLDFLARVLMHVPDQNKRRVIAYGVYSNRARGERKKKQAIQTGAEKPMAPAQKDEPFTEADEFAKKRKAAWAKLIQKIFEVNPMIYPRCGAEMKVIAVITDPAVIDKILEHLQKKKRAPPEEEAAA